MIPEKISLSKEEFVDKIKTSTTMTDLIEDFSVGRFELHILVNGVWQLYVSPNVYKMPTPEDQEFVDAVEEAVNEKSEQIRRYQQ